MKKLLITLSVLLVLIGISIPLFFTNPALNEYEAAIPTEFSNTEAKKESVVHMDYKIMSCYIATKQISSSKVEQISYFGIAGQIVPADTGIMKFFANALTWLPSLMNGAKITILLTVASVITGIFLSVFLALGKMSKFKPIKALCEAYIFFFRGTPLLMQLYFAWYGLPELINGFTINDRFFAAWLAFSLNSGAYCAEIIRAAIQSIDKGQFEAAKALGFGYGKTMSKIIIPQTYRRLIPPLANEFIMVLKDASLTSIIALKDLSKVTSSIMSSTGEVSVFVISMGIYLVITAAFSKVFEVLEKKFGIYE
jgi:polar amino acid transport system permease protein